MFCHVQFCTLNVHINICFLYGFLSCDCGVFGLGLLMRDTLDISSGWKCIVSVPHLIKHVNNSWCHIDLCHFEWNFIILQVVINSVVCFVMYNFVLWMSILTYVFVWVFFHVHVCTNDYLYPYWFSSCTCLYKWLSISLCMGFHHVHFCTNDYPFLLNGFHKLS